ncbi:PAAR domain-containing protein [Pseudomonas protegens]|uniref:PAAR domain-containing protein n=1 Tax=Pseudomonas protegens TaxID=380021 RepID=UPI00276E8907|nr:PAAR domain-containing protein [Pseudomonas protegens]MDP9529326.1 PAAR domain-containing protein [Pseudomonas protegens]
MAERHSQGTIIMSGKPAARATDPTACPIPGHGVNPIVSGSPDVIFDGLPVAREGDQTACGATLTGNLISNVLINGRPVATTDSLGSHGNVVIGGSGTVIIGTTVTVAEFTPITPVVIQQRHNAQFELLDADGESVPDFKYKVVTPDGKVYRGITDHEGLTQRIFTDVSEFLQIEPDDVV